VLQPKGGEHLWLSSHRHDDPWGPASSRGAVPAVKISVFARSFLHGMVEYVQSSNQIFRTHILSDVQAHVTKLPKTWQILHMCVCPWFNEFGWFSLWDRDNIIRILRYLVPYVIRHCILLNEILYVAYMLCICRDHKY
jgi:hypothetical protein